MSMRGSTVVAGTRPIVAALAARNTGPSVGTRPIVAALAARHTGPSAASPVATRRAHTAALVALLVGGCRTPPVARPYPPPKAGELLGRLASQQELVRSQRAEAKVDYLAEKSERVKVRMTILAAAPDKLRLEAESPFGGSVASLASDGRRFQLLDVRANRFLDGEATACNIARLIRIELPPAALVAIVGGSAPVIDARGGAQEVGWDPADGGREVLTLRSPSGLSEAIHFDARDRRWDVVEAEVRGSDGKVQLRLVHEDFSPEGPQGARLPGKTTIYQPARTGDARIRYRSRELNVAPPPDAFQLAPPPGIPVETVRCD